MRTFGKYRLVEPLASGGMADVWRAEVSGAEGVVKEVALKLVRGEHAARSDFVRMFVEEARLASRLGHANVVQVFEFDQVDGRYYLAMELVRGRHLGQVVERARELGLKLGLPRAVHVAVELARGLAHAHRLADGGRPVGLVHRDVSPHNVLVSFEGEVKLADFGIARAIGSSGLTAPGTLKGKLAYMAPEQARGDEVDARTDVFALGVVLWELCAGRRLFARESEAATLAAVLGSEPISPPSAWNEAVPPDLDAVILAALERDAARRTRSAEELGGALASVLLRVTRSPDEVDLRSFMARLWPEGFAPAGAASEATRVRSVPMAAEPAGATAVAPPPVGADGAGAVEPDGQDATRTTLARPGPSRTRALALAAGAAVVAVALAGAVRAGRARQDGVTPVATSTAAPISNPTPTPTSTLPATPTPTTTTTPPATPPATTTATPTVEAVADPNPLDAKAPAAAPASPSPLPARINARGPLYAIAVPAPASGLGVLSVNATPWGQVFVNGREVGEAPLDVELPAGRYRVRVQNRSAHEERLVVVAAGKRASFFVSLVGR